MWYPVVILGAAFLLPVLAEDSPQGTPQDKIQETPQGSDHLRAKRLTTFGKSPTGETDPKIIDSSAPREETKSKLYVPYTHGSAPRGKDCRTDEDCAALEFTLCKTDTDDRKRCLCHDLQPPANGECATKRRDARGYVLIGNRRPPKELHQNCNYDHECIQGAECVVNSTIKANEKRCYCRWGFVEEENECNDGYRLYGMFYLVLFTSFVLLTSHKN